ncbi:hypothetical protein [Pseudomonas parafulva]|uniref:Phage protein n=1 Tax=Pseudomonas parafulva TaxID=157782 RepID=A0ABM6J1R4_9PSED|nr:hypothetical protein [Pseudomonas parafulva]AQW68336.1 hypothetical protein B2J77_08985 [Pseudomonas parafulva]
MPTENRSSNTEMVSVPRDKLQAWQERFSKAQMFQQSTEVQAALDRAAPQPHPEPIAWMVGTAFWWTKEEAERDAAETGLPIVGLGPMTESADIDQLQLEIAELQLALTMHDDAAIQDECIRAENSELHAKLAERSAPIIPELTSDLREILGRPNFTCHHVAKALRVMGITIAPKSEDEQAVVIHWLLGHYLKHGADWRQRATAELEAASETMKA